MTSAPELRPAATSAAIVAVAGASSVILPTGAHWAVAGGAAIAAALNWCARWRIRGSGIPAATVRMQTAGRVAAVGACD